MVHAALGSARSVVNVGAGAGSYEPGDRYVVAVEPSASMRAQRVLPAVNAVAEALPFDDDAFDAAMAMITIHQWRDVRRGPARAAAREPRAGGDPDVHRRHAGDFWLMDYVPR